MTEAEWLECSDPKYMLEFLRGKASDRKLRLFAVACCRRILDMVEDQCRPAVELAERFADGLATTDELQIQYDYAAGGAGDSPSNRAAADCCMPDYGGGGHGAAVSVSKWVVSTVASTAADAAVREASDRNEDCDEAVTLAWGTAEGAEHAGQARLLRDIIGNPFRPVTLRPSWQTPGVLELARTIYDERAFARLPHLAKALEAVGCDDAEVLAHCRRPGEQVRGCWAVDLLLGRE